MNQKKDVNVVQASNGPTDRQRSCDIGIEIGEEGYDVCDASTGQCPIQGAQNWAEAETLQKKMTAACESELSLEEKRQRMGIEIGEEGYEICDGATGECPIRGLQSWEEATTLQKRLFPDTNKK